MKQLIEELRAAACGHPLDLRLPVMAEAADALESQALEIGRLTSQLEHWLSLDKQRNETAKNGVMFGFDDKSVMVSQEAYQIFMDRERAYREAIASNHSEQVWEEWKSGFQLHKAHKALDCGLPLPSYWAETCDGEPYVHTKLWRELPGCGSFHSSRFWPLYGVSMLAAARSAPNHSEQVREVVPNGAGNFETFCSVNGYLPTTLMRKTWEASARISGQVPQGWQLVPIEPTQSMVEVGAQCVYEPTGKGDVEDVWSNMLAAAPSAGSQGGDV